MNITPVNTTSVDAVFLPIEEDNGQITQLASELLSALHGEIKLEVSFSLDLPKIAEVLKAQAIATGENSQVLWALAAVESDPTKAVDALCERIALGEEELTVNEVLTLHLLHGKAPEAEERLVDAFVSNSKNVSYTDLGIITAYCLQKGHREALDRLMTSIAGFHTGDMSWLVDDLVGPLFAMSMCTGLTDAVLPLEDIDSSAKARLGALIASFEKDVALVDPEHYYVARLLQGEDIETIVSSCADPIYRAMIYDAAAIMQVTHNPQRAEELLSRSIDLAGEGRREVSYKEASYMCSIEGSTVEVVRLSIALGYALQDLEVGVQHLIRGADTICGSEFFEPWAIVSLIVMGLALYQDKRPLALELLDALLVKAKELDIDDIDPVPSALTVLFPERKEELASFISEEMPQLTELNLSFKREDMEQMVGNLSRSGLLDLEDTDTLSQVAIWLGALI